MEAQVMVQSLVFIGGGHAHVHALKMMGMKPIPGVQVTLITRDVDTPYSGMLPGHIAGYYTKEECHIDLQKIARFAQAALVHTEATGIDVEKKLIHCKDGRPPIRYDVLSIDIGSTPKFVESQDPNDLKRVTRVKPIDSFSARWDSIVRRVVNRSLATTNGEASTASGASSTTPSNGACAKLMVVGGGAGGVELALAMQHRLKNMFAETGRDPNMVVVGIVNRGQAVMSSHNSGVQKIFKRVLAERKIEVHNAKEVIDVRDPPEGVCGGMGKLVCKDGSEVTFSEAIWCTHSGAAEWLQDTGLALNDQGFIETNDFLESINTPGVFAVGDCAHMVNHPRPKAGVFAVRQGPPLGENLRRLMEGKQMKAYTPQKAFLGLISTGNENAVLSWRNLAKEAAYLWKFKDYIDVKWMKKYKELPEMDTTLDRNNKGSSSPPPPPPSIAAAGPAAVEAAEHASMRCGGCGSKVGGGVLRRVLARLGVDGGGEGGVGLDDAAVTRPPSEPGAMMVHTVDFFRTFVSDPYVFGRIAANHALSDVHAMGAEPTTALAIATVPFGGESQVEGTLEQLLAGCLRTLREAGCSLVGGHTCEGAEVALGLSVNGVARGGRDSLLGKGGAAVGDSLLLTKAVGTGAVLAADMRGKARSTWVEPAIHSMLQSNGPAADVLRAHGARACTDVTGFGVVGHLAEMLRAPPLHLSTQAEVQQDDGAKAVRNDEGSKDSMTSSLSADIYLDALPLLHGAEEAVEAGIVSTLQGQNERDNADAVEGGIAGEKGRGGSGRCGDDAKFRLLFDPQTAGGLIASVPRDRADACLTALRQAGCESAAIIGSFKEATRPAEGGRVKVTFARTAPDSGA